MTLSNKEQKLVIEDIYSKLISHLDALPAKKSKVSSTYLKYYDSLIDNLNKVTIKQK